MLNKLSEQVRECLEHAEDCARKAAAQPGGSPIQQDFLNLEKNWRSSARSMQLSERLTDFTNETKRTSSEPTIPFLRAQAFEPETIEAMGKALATTCEALGLSGHNGAMTKVAEKIIELAQRGINKPTALHFAAMKEFRSDPQTNFGCDDSGD
jgi:hypothetical protein